MKRESHIKHEIIHMSIRSKKFYKICLKYKQVNTIKQNPNPSGWRDPDKNSKKPKTWNDNDSYRKDWNGKMNFCRIEIQKTKGKYRWPKQILPEEKEPWHSLKKKK